MFNLICCRLLVEIFAIVIVSFPPIKHNKSYLFQQSLCLTCLLSAYSLSQNTIKSVDFSPAEQREVSCLNRSTCAQ